MRQGINITTTRGSAYHNMTVCYVMLLTPFASYYYYWEDYNAQWKQWVGRKKSDLLFFGLSSNILLVAVVEWWRPTCVLRRYVSTIDRSGIINKTSKTYCLATTTTNMAMKRTSRYCPLRSTNGGKYYTLYSLPITHPHWEIHEGKQKKKMIFMIKCCCYMSSAFHKDKCGFNVGEHDILFFPCVNDAVVLCKTFFGMLCGWWCYEEVGNHDMT